jgi:hypothetical protein
VTIASPLDLAHSVSTAMGSLSVAKPTELTELLLKIA